MTLRFLGDIGCGRIARLAGCVREQTAALGPFRLQLGGARLFPSKRRPLAVVLDVGPAAPPAALSAPVERGVGAAAGGVIRLQRIVGKRVAMEWARTGDFFTAQRAYEVGFVNRVTEGAALEAAIELATTVAANGPLALKATKKIINESYDWTSEEAWKKQAEITTPVFTSKDAQEGSLAFAQKRKPDWKGE